MLGKLFAQRREEKTAKGYLSLLAMLVLLISIFPQITVSSQPPVVTDTLYVGQIAWGPRRADPVRAYDTFSGELIFNVYDTLISMGASVTNAYGTWEVHEQYWEFLPSLATNVPYRQQTAKLIQSADVNLADPTGSTWTDGSVCVGWVNDRTTGDLDAGDVLYMIDPDSSYRTWYVDQLDAGPPVSVSLCRYYYTFNIRTSPVISFVNSTGQNVDTFDVYDAEYSFKRGLVQDQYASPMWMFYKPLFDQQNSDFIVSNVTQPTPLTLAHLIDDAVEVSGNNLTINLGMAYPDISFKQILTQTWSSIMSKEWCISRGCWNGNLFADANANGTPDWFEPYPTGWRHVGAGSIPINTVTPGNYAGTGPYRVTTADSASNLVVLQRNPNYWKGWPAPYRTGSTLKSYLETVELHYISDWSQRKAAFLTGDLDTCSVPRAYMNELLNDYGEPSDPQVKMIKNLNLLGVEVAFFNFNINWEFDFLGSGHFPDGIPVNFFNNTQVRRAFAYGFNHSKYLKEVMLNDAICRETPLIYGLDPDYYTKGPNPPYTYDANYAAAEAELKQAMFGATSVWDSGFSVKLPYIEGQNDDRAALEILRDFFGNLSTYDGRTAPAFNVEVVSFNPFILMYWDYTMFPMFLGGWLADFSDADNFIRPFMHSNGDLAGIQRYTAANGWGKGKDELTDLAVKAPDGPERAVLYAELQDLYISDCPSFPIAQQRARRWQKYWVKGWYYNPLYPSDYYYDLYKEDACWGDVTGSYVGVPDGVCAMRDIGYIAGHFRARAPDTTKAQAYDPKWAPGRYSCGGCDVYGDRKVDMRDIGFACMHFGDTNEP
jgi:peptide/nickel transport system substrate-binding protein